MSVDITHLENKPELDDISSDSVEIPKKPKSKSKEEIVEDEDISPPELTEVEKKEKELICTMLELYKISFPKLKPFQFNNDMTLVELRSIKKSCEAQLSAGSSIDIYENTFFKFLTGIEIMMTSKGYDLSGFTYLCQNDEPIRNDLRLVVIRIASHFSPRPEFRLILNVLSMAGTALNCNMLAKQKELLNQQLQQNNNPPNNNQQINNQPNQIDINQLINNNNIQPQVHNIQQ